MDVTICLPALYPLRYVVDHLEYRSPSTQSASLQAIKFFYDFWFIIENFDTFIIEQKVWFEENLAADFAESWDSLVWICGKK